MLFPRLRSLLSLVASVKSSRGRFLAVVAGASSICSSCAAACVGSWCVLKIVCESWTAASTLAEDSLLFCGHGKLSLLWDKGELGVRICRKTPN